MSDEHPPKSPIPTEFPVEGTDENPIEIDSLDKTKKISENRKRFEEVMQPLESIKFVVEDKEKIQLVRNNLGLPRNPSEDILKAKLDEPKAPFRAKDELDRIRGLSREERKTAMSEFKAKLMAQREAWASSRVRIERVLEKNPDTPKEEITKLFAESPEERELAEEILDQYYIARAQTLEARALYPNNIDLVNHLTGLSFPHTAAFDIKINQMAIDIYASSEDADEIYGIKNAGINGFAKTSSEGVYYSIINKSSSDPEGTARHELQHQKNNLFGDIFKELNISREARKTFNSIYENDSSNQEDKKAALETYFPSLRAFAYDLAKDEIFAMMTNNKFSPNEMASFFKANSGYSHDYLKVYREDYLEDPLWQEVSDQILVKEYEKVISTACLIVDDLSKFYKTEEIIALLTDIPLERWSIEAARIYQEKTNRSRIEKLLNPEGSPNKIGEKEKAGTAKKPWKEMSPKEKAAAGIFNAGKGLMGGGLTVAGIGLGIYGLALGIDGLAGVTGLAALGGPAATFGIGAGIGGFFATALGYGMIDLIAWNFAKDLFNGGALEILGDWISVFGTVKLGGGGGGAKPAKKAAAPKAASGGGDHGGGH
jgi:hypothetical protein